MTTGHGACWATCAATDPIDSREKPPAPREPSTIMSAPSPALMLTGYETGDARVLLECGPFRGGRELRRRNWKPFPTAAEQIDTVVLTHAHLDHCGYLPALARQGFACPVFATPCTAELAEIVLRDSARLQAEEAEHADHGGRRPRQARLYA